MSKAKELRQNVNKLYNDKITSLYNSIIDDCTKLSMNGYTSYTFDLVDNVYEEISQMLIKEEFEVLSSIHTSYHAVTIKW